MCIIIGGDDSRWKITSTMIPGITINIQFTKPASSPASELLFAVKLLHPTARQQVVDSIERKSYTLDMVRSGFIYALGYRQEYADGVLRYPTTLLNLGPVSPENLRPVSGVVYPFGFMIQLRSVITTVISRETPAEATFSLIASIGGLASTINTILSVFIGVILTRLCFKDRSAFFEHKTRLAATYFVHQQEQQNRLNSDL